MSTFFSVESEGVRERLLRFGQDIVHAARDAVRDATSAGEQHAKATTQYKDRPAIDRPPGAGPHLRTVTKGKLNGPSYGGFSGTVTANKPYALWLEYGTRAHGPVRAQFLRFTIGGVKIRTKWVKGITPRHFMRDAFNHGKTVLDHALDIYTTDAIRKFNT